jgi:intraflagellar transport protein 46
LFEYIQRYKP